LQSGYAISMEVSVNLDPTTPNPVCTDGSDLPPPPSIGEEEDPAEPHPDEPRPTGAASQAGVSGD
jgi:hypothetical protein